MGSVDRTIDAVARSPTVRLAGPIVGGVLLDGVETVEITVVVGNDTIV